MAIASTSQLPTSDGDIFHAPVVKETSRARYRSGDLKGGRTAVITDLGPTISQVSFQSFLNTLLPSTCDVPKTIQKLEKGGHIVHGRWAIFPVDPGKSASLEDATFAPLQ
jgi:hypothetical protein